MKISHLPLAAFLLAASAVSCAQTKPPSDSGPPVPSVPDRGMSRAPDSSPMKTPSDSGMVVTPPDVGPEIAKTPPKNIDPKINDATGEIDRKNRKKSEDKQKAQ
jgi:hypothetical protein